MKTIQLNFQNWELVVDLDGGRIVGLKNNGVLILGSFERIDGKKGNTHICVPNFADNGVEKYGLPFHGPFRNDTWNLLQQTENTIDMECEIDSLNVHQILSLDSEYFTQKIIMENKSNEQKPINAAIHNYWSSDLGWEGVTLNNFNLSQGIKESIFIDLNPINELNISGKSLIKWQLTGLSYAKLWTGFLEEGKNKIFDNNYFCIEPIIQKNETFFGSPDSMLPSKKIKEIEQKIGIKSDF